MHLIDLKDNTTHPELSNIENVSFSKGYAISFLFFFAILAFRNLISVTILCTW